MSNVEMTLLLFICLDLADRRIHCRLYVNLIRYTPIHMCKERDSITDTKDGTATIVDIVTDANVSTDSGISTDAGIATDAGINTKPVSPLMPVSPSTPSLPRRPWVGLEKCFEHELRHMWQTGRGFRDRRRSACQSTSRSV